MPGLLRGMARTAVVAGTATAVSNRVSRRQASRWGAQEGYGQQQRTPNPRTRSQPPRLKPTRSSSSSSSPIYKPGRPDRRGVCRPKGKAARLTHTGRVTFRAVGLAVLVSMVVVASAQAGGSGGNLILNPGAEADAGSTDSSCGGDLDVALWGPETDTFSAVQYGTGGFPSTAVGAQIGGGSNLFTGGCPTTNVSTGEQTAVVSGAAAAIDGGQVAATLSGYLGGFQGQDDQARVDVFFRGAGGSDLGSPGADLRIGPVTAADRGGLTDLLLRSADGGVPPGTRSVLTRLTLTRFSGSADDAYADNLSLTLGAAVPPPAPGTAVNVAPVKGHVFVKVRGGSFEPLEGVEQIPPGSLLDTRRGTVSLTSAHDKRGNTQTGEFSAGVFQIRQSRKSSAKGLTELRLNGGSFGRCGKSRGAASGAARPHSPGARSAASGRRRRVASAPAAATARPPYAEPSGRRSTAATARSQASNAGRWRCATSAARRRSSCAPGRATSREQPAPPGSGSLDAPSRIRTCGLLLRRARPFLSRVAFLRAR